MSSAAVLLLHPSPERELIDSVAAAGAPFVALTSRPVDDARAAARYVYAPGDDLPTIAAAVATRHSVRAVPPLWEGMVETAAAVSARLGLRHNSTAAAAATRDKAKAAECYAATGVASPRSLLFDANDPASKVEAAIAYPLVVKLPRSTNSQSVTLVRSRAALERAVAQIAALYEKQDTNRLGRLYATAGAARPILAQEYISGPELNIDLLYAGGEFRVAGVFEKYPMHGPAFEEVQSVYPVAFSAGDVDACVEVAIAAVRALGASCGAAHVELRLASHGPTVIETALRPGGFYTPQAIRLLTGIDPIQALTRLLLTGELPDVDARRASGACLYGAVNVAAEGRIRHIGGVDAARGVKSVLSFELIKREGDWVAPLPAASDYHVARFILTGSGRDDLEDDAERIRRSISVEVETAAC